jgi:glycosyltransferase involved in cell wall biosynthesis
LTDAKSSQASGQPPFVSVIVPIYNGEHGVRGLLDALAMQDYPRSRFEILIVDNGSSDRTMELIEGFARQTPDLALKLAKEHERRGSYAARNLGVSLAKGAILAFTDGDCRPIPGWISAGVRALADSAADQAAGAIEFMFSNEPPNLWEHLDSVMHLRQDTYVRDNAFGATANLFVRAEALRSVNGFRADLQSGGDFEFGQRMRDAGFRIVFAPEARILHEARNSHREIATKVRRVATGLSTLTAEGRLPQVSLNDFKPRRRLPQAAQELTRGLVRNAALLALMNYFHYMRLRARMKAAARNSRSRAP